jgi:peptide/nickel transport system substrate-binding protein
MSNRLLLAALAATAIGAATPAMAQKTVTIVREIDTDRYDPHKSTAPALAPRSCT